MTLLQPVLSSFQPHFKTVNSVFLTKPWKLNYSGISVPPQPIKGFTPITGLTSVLPATGFELKNAGWIYTKTTSARQSLTVYCHLSENVFRSLFKMAWTILSNLDQNQTMTVC